MANPSKRAGTEGENRAVEIVQAAGYTEARRLLGNVPGHDIIDGPGIPVEVKRQKNLLVPAWSRALTDRHGDEWALFIIPRDKRLKDAVPELMVVPAQLGADMLAAWEAANGLL